MATELGGERGENSKKEKGEQERRQNMKCGVGVALGRGEQPAGKKGGGPPGSLKTRGNKPVHWGGVKKNRLKEGRSVWYWGEWGEETHPMG